MNVRGSVYWTLAAQVLSFIISFSNTILLARILSPREFGIFGIAVAAQAMVQVFLTFGISAYVTQHKELSATVLASAFTVNAVISVLLSGALFGLSFLAEPLLRSAEAGNVLRILALGSLLLIFSFRPTAMLAREMAFKTISLVTLLSVCVTTGVTLGCALAGAGYMSAAWGILAGAIAQAFVYNIVGHRHASLRFSLTGAREVFRFGMTMTLLSGSTVLASRFSEIVLGRVQGLSALGYYGRATSITAIIQDNIYVSATKISYVKLAEDARTNGDLRPTLLRSLQLIVGLLWPVQIGLAITAAPVLNLIYGPQWHAAALPLSLILVAQALMLMFGMNWEIFTLRGKLRQQVKIEMMRTLGGALVFVVAAQFSLTAAAAARILEALLGLVLYRGKVADLAGTQSGELGHIYLQGAALTGCAVTPAFLLMVAWHWSPQTPIQLVAAAIGSGLILWLGALHLINHPLRDEIMTVLRLSKRVL